MEKTYGETLMQSLSKIIQDIRDEGHPYRTLKRKAICNLLGSRPERWAYRRWIDGCYYYTEKEGDVWNLLPIPSIPMRRMENILRSRLNWRCAYYDPPAGNLTMINIGFWHGTDFEPAVNAHSVLFPDGRIWDSYFRGFRPKQFIHQNSIFLKNRKRLLNVGCGRDYIEGATNVDNLQITSYTNYKIRQDFIADACNLPSVWTERFDTALASHLFEHQKDPNAFIDEMHRVLKSKGRLIIVVPNYEYMGHKAYYRDPTHIWPFTPKWIKQYFDSDERWEILQFNRLGMFYKFSTDIVLEKK